MRTDKNNSRLFKYLFRGWVPVSMFLFGAFIVSSFASDFSALMVLFGFCLSTLLIGVRMVLCPTRRHV